jgi:sulfide:quinone oxidoreductase
MSSPSPRRGNGLTPRLVIVGGGVAALEAMLALREFAGGRVEVELHAPGREFAYRPLLVGKPFGTGKVIDFDLDELARAAGVAFYRDKVVAIEPDHRQILTHDGEKVPYDYLLFCPGAEPQAAVPGAETFWGVGDEGPVVRVVRRLKEGEFRRVAFVIPGPVSWSLPIYELALMTEADLAGAGITDAKLTVVSPEDLPLGIFGVRAGEHVRGLLSQRGIEVITGAHPVEFENGLLQIAPGDPIEADAVISAPRLEGRQIAGIPCDEFGFVNVDEHNRVIGVEGIFAAGDVTSFPVKQGGLAAQQADTVAEAIAADLGIRSTARPFDPILRAVLWTGAQPQYLYGMLSGGHGETSVFSENPLWEREGKIVGQYLAPFLSSRPGVERPGAQTGARRQAADSDG